MPNLPNHFFKFIRPGFKYNISIPVSFWTKLNDVQCKTSILRRGRRQWLVELSDEGVFGDGWRELVRDNGVQEFDFIVFKHQGNMVFEFMVFNQTSCERQYQNFCDEMDVKEPIKKSDPIYTDKGTKKLKKRKGDNFESQYEDKFEVRDDKCFVSIMTPYIIKSSRLHIPIKFARSNGLFTRRRRTQIVLLDEAQRSWPATLIFQKTDVRLTNWHELSINKHLQVGDVCMFELVKQGEVPVFKFSRKNQVKNHIQVKETTSTIKEFGSTLNNRHYFSSVNEETYSEKDDLPYFSGEVKSYSLKGAILYLPSEFAKRNGLINKEEMILINVKDESSWTVKLKNCMNRYYYIGSGWKEFCVANGLKEGDRFKLELTSNGEKPIAKFYF